MYSEEARIGMKVRVRTDHWRPEFRDRPGTIEQRYGSPDYAALEVRFEDGNSQLFWHYELDDLDRLEGKLPGQEQWWRRVLRT